MIDIIPAIDLIDGQCVRLTQGDYTQKKVYHSDPLEMAKSFEANGIQRLHLVDLDGAKQGSLQHTHILEQIAANTTLKVDFGGGVKSLKDVEQLLNAGAYMATIGSLAVKQPEQFLEIVTTVGGQQIFLGADVKDELIRISGWLEATGINIFDFIEEKIGQGIAQIFCTDISKDGAMQGPSIKLYKQLIAKFPNMHLVASGGVTHLSDLHDLDAIGCKGVIVGKAIYEGNISLQDIRNLYA